jgi:hypothetical protein
MPDIAIWSSTTAATGSPRELVELTAILGDLPASHRHLTDSGSA